ncbi:MAG: VWA domain-containing protein [Phycisphaerales bacterium]|jgi:Ca-activated chloride channel family protein|nr:VWA domain-containing protein [Phycisphaerales bacterium]
MDIQFNNPNNSIYIWAVVALATILVMGHLHRSKLLRKIASSRLIPRLTKTSSDGRRRFRIGLLIAASIMLCLSILDPRWGTKYREVEQQGIDTFFVLDVSRSMLAEDVKPNRLDRAITAITDVLDVMGSDRAGLVTVAGDAALTVPLTLDYSSLRLSLDDVSPRSVKRGGTKIGDGIRLAQKSFTDDEQEYKTIIVLTDGEDMGSFPSEAAADAAAAGIDVYTVGIGDSTTGARIPTTLYGQPSFITHEGEEVWSIMNPDELANIANAGNGLFIPAGTANLDLASIYAQRIATDAGKSFDSVKLEQFIPRFQWFAIPALIILFGDSWMSLRPKNKTKVKSYEVPT